MVALLAGPIIGGSVVKGLAIAYGAPAAASGIQKFFGTQFQGMKAPDNMMVAQSGRILEATVAGYGIGYVTPVAIMAAGHLILGNPLSALGTIGSAAILSNPIAATCAAAGALFYGYAALTESERAQLIASIASGLAVGEQLIRSIIEFFIAEMKKALDADALAQLKARVAEYALAFGSNIAEVTRALVDRVQVGFGNAYDGVVQLGQGASGAMLSAATSGSAFAGKAIDQITALVVTQGSRKEEPEGSSANPADAASKTD